MGLNFINKEDVFREIYKQFNINKEDLVLDENILIPFIRKISSILCPISESQIRKYIFDLLDVSKNDEDYNKNLENFEKSIEKLKIIGDLNEIFNFDSFDDKFKSTYLYTKQPSYLILNSKLILIGIDNNGSFPIPESVKSLINFNNYDRVYEIKDDDKNLIKEEFSKNSINIMSRNHWLKKPKKLDLNKYIQEYSILLEQKEQQVSYEIEDKSNFLLLNFNKPTNYFKGRFEYVNKQTGNYILKRTKGFNQTGWSYGKIKKGEIIALLDFPTRKNLQSMNRFDEAMYLQSAIDFNNNNTQEIKITTTDDFSIIDFFHPVPRWVKRYLTNLGDEYFESKSLFSYKLKYSQDLKKNIDYIENLGWYKIIYE
tara:strand:+ start:53 stop:1162 length:1110 start_codon:yes stop_codon:yes gene_type:complete